MKKRMIACVLTTVLTVAGHPPSAPAAAPLIITMKVTAQGLQVSGIAMQEKRMVIPRGTRVRLVLEYADTNRNAHQFTLTAKNTSIVAPVIDGETRQKATIDFTVGDRGQEFYRLSCELPCISMDELVDYIIMVGPPQISPA